MLYQNIKKARFLTRPNRFIAHVAITDQAGNDQEAICHVKNTGRCKELLLPNRTVYVNHSPSPTRRTAYDLVAVEKPTPQGNILINMDSQAPNQIFKTFLASGQFLPHITHIKPEYKYNNSRIDFYVETNDGTTTNKILIEVKGVTLEQDGIAMFPDAPTERGIKHLKALAHSINDGYQAMAIFVIQMEGIAHFTPNYATHKAFGEALQAAQNSGVQILAYDCQVTPSNATIHHPIPIIL